jgi:hypothetical protein
MGYINNFRLLLLPSPRNRERGIILLEELMQIEEESELHMEEENIAT